MLLSLRVLEATDVVCIGGIGIPVFNTSGVVTPVMGHTLVPDMAADTSGPCSMFVKTIILPLIHYPVMMI